LPGASAADLDVAVIEDELVVRAGSRRRSIPLPPRVARLSLGDAELRDGTLVVSFVQPAPHSEPTPEPISEPISEPGPS
jgi:HSP20 family molecular chaperone IbpA